MKRSSSSTSCRRAFGGEDMSETTGYRLGPDIHGEQELRDRQGRAVDDAYVQRAVDEALQRVRGPGVPFRMGAPGARRGHPSSRLMHD